MPLSAKANPWIVSWLSLLPFRFRVAPAFPWAFRTLFSFLLKYDLLQPLPTRYALSKQGGGTERFGRSNFPECFFPDTCLQPGVRLPTNYREFLREFALPFPLPIRRACPLPSDTALLSAVGLL